MNPPAPPVRHPKSALRSLAAAAALLLPLAFSACHPADTAPDPDTLYLTTARFRGFEPALAGDDATLRACGKIYETLYEYDYWARPYRIEPLLAAAAPAVSDDGLVWTIPVRPGIYFSDDPCFPGGRGRELTAADFVYSFLRIADPAVGSSGYWIFRGKIAGLDDFRARAAASGHADYDAPPPGLRALDDRTLQITLAEPYPQLLWILAMPYAAAIPREAVEFYGPDFPNHPVGTGPYVLASMRQNHRYEYRANPAWTDPSHPRTDAVPADAPTPDAGRPLPLTPRIVETVVGDASTAWLLFLTHALDKTGISNDQWDSVIAATPSGPALRPEIAARGIRLESSPTLSVSYYSFNLDDPVVGPNRALRQALSHAFDFAEWQRFQNGRLLQANSILPPGVAGYDPADPVPYPFDLDRARALLEEAGYPGGRDPATGRRLELTLEIGAAESPDVRQSVELLASFFDKIGIRLLPSYNNWPSFLKKIELRQAQMFGLIWIGDYPDAQNFLQLFYSPNVSPGPNRCNYVNPEFDALYERFTALPDSPERTALCREAVRVVMADAPWIVTGYPLAFNLQQPRLRNSIRTDFPFATEKYHAVR
jgi:ABC-type transport system substrate-binding protein